MSDTPRTDKREKELRRSSLGYAGGIDIEFVRDLEREIARLRESQADVLAVLKEVREFVWAKGPYTMQIRLDALIAKLEGR